MQIRTLVVGQFQANCFLVTDPDSQASVIIDVGEGADLVRHLQSMEPVPRLAGILITHAHVDHAGGLVELQKSFDAPTWLPELERPLFETLPSQGNWFGMPSLNRPCGRIDHWLKDGDEFQVEGMDFQFISTPGHSPGQGCFRIQDHIFVGDTLFAGSIGRVDLPLGDHSTMNRSLARLMELPETLQVHCGHGPGTTLADELRSNPYLAHVRKARGMQEPKRGFWW